MLVPTYDGMPTRVIVTRDNSFVLIQGKYFRVSKIKAKPRKPALRLIISR